jgi:hypothetical protein
MLICTNADFSTWIPPPSHLIPHHMHHPPISYPITCTNQDYTCTKADDAIAGGKMACDYDPSMEMRAHTQAKWYGAPAKMFCAPKSKMPKAPKWNYMYPWCPQPGGYNYTPPFPDNVSMSTYIPYVNKGKAGGGCKDYTPIMAGGWNFCGGGGCKSSPAPLFNHSTNPDTAAGRTDVEGCCWYGRGVIQTSGEWAPSVASAESVVDPYIA